jgi:4-alpha-glucanotransferase
MNHAFETLTRKAGLAVAWSDATGMANPVRADTVRAILDALTLPAVDNYIDQEKQPNISGITDRHSNWCRRLKSAQPVAAKSLRRRAPILIAGWQ